MLGYLIEKEFKQIKRDFILPMLILLFPFIALILLPYAANFEFKDIRVVVVDNDKSSYSNQVLNKLRANTSININYFEDTYVKAMELIHEDRADMIINIPLGFEKDYIVNVNKDITSSFIKGMSNGVKIYNPVRNEYTVTNRCKVVKLGDRSFEITLTQGLNRQIRRMCARFNYKVVKLKRIRIMNIELNNLALGKWRNLTEEELRNLLEIIKLD